MLSDLKVPCAVVMCSIAPPVVKQGYLLIYTAVQLKEIEVVCSLRKHLNYLKGQTNASKAAEGKSNASIYHFEGHLSRWRNIPDTRRICLPEITEGTQMKVNHYITFYMSNPILLISLSIAVKALRQQ